MVWLNEYHLIIVCSTDGYTLSCSCRYSVSHEASRSVGYDEQL